MPAGGYATGTSSSGLPTAALAGSSSPGRAPASIQLGGSAARTSSSEPPEAAPAPALPDSSSPGQSLAAIKLRDVDVREVSNDDEGEERAGLDDAYRSLMLRKSTSAASKPLPEMPNDELDRLEILFRDCDVNGDGTIVRRSQVP